MRRREFITLLGSAAAAWPLVARAQQSAKTIGFLGASTPSSWSSWSAAFVQRLRELGWVEGRTVAIEYRGRRDALNATRRSRPSSSASRWMSSLRWEARPSPHSKRHRSSRSSSRLRSIPLRLVWSLRWDGREETSPACRCRQLILPVSDSNFCARCSLVSNAWRSWPTCYLASVVEIGKVQAAARKLAYEVDILEIRRTEDIAPVFGTLKSAAQALYVCGDALTTANRARINTLAMGARLPTIYPDRLFLEAGGFMAYGANNADLFRRAADYVDKILRGAKPAELPVEQPTRFDLAINLIAAKALGIDVPPSLLARADEVIE